MPESSSARGEAVKRAVDLALLALTAPAWMAVLFLVAIAIRVVDGPPVFFVQLRSGRGGRPFRLIKFRSMRVDLDPEGRLLPDAVRLTRLGRFLRASSLDELPEVLNVLLGDMSLVGPRPLLTQYLERYSANHRHRLDVRPGLTGLAQVSGRNALTWEERFDLDTQYVRTRTLRQDFAILWRTVYAVIQRTGITADGDATMPEFTGYSKSPTSGKSEERR